jgi:hypothetical protein
VDGTFELAHFQIDGDWPLPFDVVRVEIDGHRLTAYQDCTGSALSGPAVSGTASFRHSQRD